jgi:thiosulfate dehydrogenase (quinone) large subunit
VSMKSSQPLQSPAIPDITTHRLAAVRPSALPASASSAFSGWMLLPQRLFLALTFLYAGVQKLVDPQFFHKATPGYIGNQIIGFAHGSPLHTILIKVVLSHAVLFGWAVALGEVAIGLGVLLGALFRPAAFFGLLLSTMFFLTASWNVYPYFYGADIVFMFGWFTLLLTGPLPTGLPSLDGKIQKVLFPRGFSAAHGWPVRLLSVALLGVNTLRATDPTAPEPQPASRRSFLRGALAGGITVTGVAVMGLVLRAFNRPAASGSTASGVASGSSQGATTPGAVIAQVKAVPTNSAVTFTITSTGDPGVLIHLANNQFVAYDATCTHAGCQVGYDAASQHLICPCHGATFDPAHQAAVLQGPAGTPLTGVPLHVDASTGDITVAS